MAQYFRSGDKINLDQTEVEISAENGLDFKENQVIGIYVPPNVRFFSGKESRLSFDVELSPDTAGDFGATALQLDGTIGGQSLFSKCRIYAGNRAQLIEETDAYDTMVSVKYAYESNDSIRNKRGLTEGCGAYLPECRCTTGCLKSNQSNTMTNPYFEQRFHGENKLTGAGGKDTQAIADKMQKAHIEMPLHMGCFANNTKAFPNVLTDGIYVELTCNPAVKVMRTLDNLNRNRSMYNNPMFNGAHTTGTAWKNADAARTKIFLKNDVNMMTNAQHCPFVVGEKLGFFKANIAGTREIALDAVPVISEITTAGGEIELTINACKPAAAADDIDPAADDVFVFSISLDQTGTYTPSYTISDVKLIVHQVNVGPEYESGMMAKMKQGGVIAFDIPSVACHKTSLLKADRQATINLNMDHAKCRSIISVPTDATVYAGKDKINSKGTYNWFTDNEGNTGVQYLSDTSGLTGCGNNLTSYNYQLNGLLVPSRAVKTKKSSTHDSGGIDGEHILELEKALLGAGVVPLSFKDYKKNFCIGRVLAMDANTVYDGRGVDTRLLLDYGDKQADVQMLWCHYIHHIKTLNIRGEGIQIEN
jgi:hypothetical protein